MAKKRPQTKAKRPQLTDGQIPVVGAREPCPCGSGRRYKACHGRAAAHAATELVHRPFEGLPGECDWVALRELVPAATAGLTLKGGLPDGVPSVTLATVLPMAWPALRRDDGSVLLGLQNDTSSGDISRDLADTLQRALTADPGTPVQSRRAPADGPRLQDLLDPEGAFEPVVHSGFEFWVPDPENAKAFVTASLDLFQRGGHPDGQAVGRGLRVLVRDAREEPSAVGHAVSRGAASGRSRAAARGGPVLPRRGHPPRGLLPRSRAHRAGLGPAQRGRRRGRGEAGRRVRRAARPRAGLGRAAHRGRAPCARRSDEPPGHAQL
ncbi:LOW QUALITY PROTEIN: conserved hypothetical protein, partial [Streptomyces griseoflavus Tu4000]